MLCPKPLVTLIDWGFNANATEEVRIYKIRRTLLTGFYKSRRLITIIAASIAVLDHGTKILVQEFLPLHTSIAIVPNVLDFTHARNTGVAFGILNTVDFPFKSTVMLVIAAAALSVIIVYAAGSTSNGRIAQVGLGLIIGGALGNLIDRAMTGYVVDFIDVYWQSYHFWTFNLADSAITVGAAFLIIDTLMTGQNVSATT